MLRFSRKHNRNTFGGTTSKHTESRKFRKVSRRYESIEDGWIRSSDDLYDLPFMEGDSNGYYGDGGSSKYHTIECSIDDGKFFCRYETHDVGAIVEDNDMFARGIIFSALPETQAIYGFLIAILLMVFGGILA